MRPSQLMPTTHDVVKLLRSISSWYGSLKRVMVRARCTHQLTSAMTCLHAAKKDRMTGEDFGLSSFPHTRCRDFIIRGIVLEAGYL